MVSFRDEKKKFSISFDEVTKERIERWAEELKQRLRNRAIEMAKSKIGFFENLDDLANWIERRGVGLIYLCGSTECGEVVEEKAKGSVLGRFEEIPDWLEGFEYKGRCIVCGEEGYLTGVAKTY